MSVDYIDCILLGVGRQLMKPWLKTKHHKELWYIGGSLADLDSHLCAITPPAEIKRTPRSIATTLKFWKGNAQHTVQSVYYLFVSHYIAHEVRAWVFHYSPLVLHGLLPDIYYQHHLLLVEGVFLLLQDVVRSEITHSTRLL